ncbi:quinon protein alcohol dehydrogenase-like superfamily, partial [Melanogaster broomeanus]
VAIWNSRTGEQLRTWQAHDNFVALSLSPAGTHLATCAIFGSAKEVLVFDVSTGEQVEAFEYNAAVRGIVYLPSGQFIETASRDKNVYLWEA